MLFEQSQACLHFCVSSAALLIAFPSSIPTIVLENNNASYIFSVKRRSQQTVVDALLCPALLYLLVKTAGVTDLVKTAKGQLR